MMFSPMMAFPPCTLIPGMAMSFLGWCHRHCPDQEVEACDEPALRLLGTESSEDGIWWRDDDIMRKRDEYVNCTPYGPDPSKSAGCGLSLGDLNHTSVNQCVRTGNLTKPLKGSRTVHRNAQNNYSREKGCLSFRKLASPVG